MERRRPSVFANFILRRQGTATIWVDRQFAEQKFIDRLADADRLLAEPGCQIIKNQRKIKVARLTAEIAGESRSLYLKRYNAFSLRYKLVSPFVQSGAIRSLQGAAILREAAIPTAVAVAAVENRSRGALSKSFFISEEIAGGKTADAYWRDELLDVKGRNGIALRRRFLAALGALCRSLHARQIYHNDLKDANILVVADHKKNTMRLFLLDLEGVRRYTQLSANRRVKNLVQLNRTLGRYLRRPDKLFFLKCYLASSFAEENLKRDLIESVIQESDRLDVVKARRAREAVTGATARDD